MWCIITALFITDPRAEALLARRLAIEVHWYNVAVEAGIPFGDWEEHHPIEEDWGDEAQSELGYVGETFIYLQVINHF